MTLEEGNVAPSLAQGAPVEVELHRSAAPEHWSGRTYTIGLLILICAVYAIDKVSIAVVIESIGKDFGLRDSQRGLLTGMGYGIAFAMACIPAGMLIDRYSRKWVLTGLLAAWSAFTVVCGLAPNFPLLFGCRLLVGAAEAGAFPATMSLLCDLVTPRRRATAVSMVYVGAGLGASCAAVGGAAVAERFGWKATFFAAGVLGLLLAIVLALTVREPKRGATGMSTSAEAQSLPQVARFLASQRVLIHTFIAATCAATAGAVLNSWCVSFFVRWHHVSLARAGLIFAAAVGPGIILGAFLGGVAGDGLSRRSPAGRVRLAGIATAAGIPLAVFTFNTPVLARAACGFFALTLVVSMFYAPAAATIVSYTPSRMRGVMLSLKEVLANLVGLGAGPLLVGGLSDLWGGDQSLRPALLTILIACLLLSAGNFFIAATLATRRHPVN